jgi:hypothetical protein
MAASFISRGQRQDVIPATEFVAVNSVVSFQ